MVKIRVVRRIALLAALLVSVSARAQWSEDFEEGFGPFGGNGWPAAKQWHLVPNNPGNAFFFEPTVGENVMVSRIPSAPGFQLADGSFVPLGGDYWQTPYPVNKTGNNWIGTFEFRPDTNTSYGTVQGDSFTGAVWGPTFSVWGSNGPNLWFRIGGGQDLVNEKVEMLMIDAGNQGESAWVAEDTAFCLGTWTSPYFGFPDGCASVPAWTTVPVQNIDGSAVPNNAATGQNDERMRQVFWRFTTPPFHCSSWSGSTCIASTQYSQTQVRIHIVDNSSGGWGHINVDSFLQSDQLALSLPTPPSTVWGFADLHSHWMEHMGFGATVNGGPFWYTNEGGGLLGGQSSYSPQSSSCGPGCALRQAIPQCDGATHQGSLSRLDSTSHAMSIFEGLGSELAAAASDTTDAIGCGPLPTDCWHSRYGVAQTSNGYAFVAPPNKFASHIHQQMYWEWVKRAWQGGLRLLITDATNSRSIEAVIGRTAMDVQTDNGYLFFLNTTPENVVAERQICATKRLMTTPEVSPWAEIAYSPADARRIIGNGKLAVVLGVEMDSVGGNMGLSPGWTTPDAEISSLVSLGVREIKPVHLVDNANAGSAVYVPDFSTYNDAMNAPGSQLLGSPPYNLPAPHDPSLDWLNSRQATLANLSNHGFIIGARSVIPGDPANDRAYYPAFGPLPYVGVPIHAGDDLQRVPTGWDPTTFFQIEPGCPTNGTDGAGYCSTFRLGWNPAMNSGAGGFSSTLSRYLFGFHDVVDEGITALSGISLPLYTGLIQKWAWAPLDYPIGGATGQPAVTNFPAYSTIPGGHRNARGLANRLYVQRMMMNGLIIDIAHMSEKGYTALIGRSNDPSGQTNFVANSSAYASLPNPMLLPASCGNTIPAPGSWCAYYSYPVVATHNGLRKMTQLGAASMTVERALADEDVQRIYAMGGMVGLGTGAGNTAAGTGAPMPNDCQGSSKSFGQEYYELRHLIAGTGFAPTPFASQYGIGAIGLGTDFNSPTTQVGPRFTALSTTDSSLAPTLQGVCPGRWMDVITTTDALTGGITGRPNQGLNSPGIAASCPSSADACGHQEALLQRNGSSGYRNGVVYVDDPAGGNQNNVNTVAQQSARLVRQRMTLSDAPFIQSDPNLTDFNQQGLWNYGLLPDFLQDVVNSSDSTGVAGNPPRQQVIQDMESLMLSAEQFIETWEKSQRACQALAQPIFAFQFTAGSLNCTPPPPTDGATCDILSYQ